LPQSRHSKRFVDRFSDIADFRKKIDLCRADQEGRNAALGRLGLRDRDGEVDLEILFSAFSFSSSSLISE
jgi:hypothetical protein